MPQLSTFYAGSLKQAQKLGVMHLGGFRAARRLSAYDGGTLRIIATFTPALSASITPDSATGSAFSGAVTTNTVTAVPSGGQAPFTYAWSLISYDGPTPTITAPSSASTAFRGTVNHEALFQVTVTDALGNTAQAQVTASFVSIA